MAHKLLAVSTDEGMVGKKIKMDNLLGTHSGD